MEHAGFRHSVHAIYVGLALRPRWRFWYDLVLGRSGSYRVARTGMRISLRPRSDLLVGREFISRVGPLPPPEIQAALRRHPPENVLDLGANIGLFTLWSLEHFPTCKVVALEPDTDNLQYLVKNVALNTLQDHVEIIPTAAGTAEGVVYLEAGRAELSRLKLAGESVGDARPVPMADALPLIDASDLVKIDIEGSEWPILRDPRFASARARFIFMEWHSRGSGSDDPRRSAVETLIQAGFDVCHVDGAAKGCGTLWGMRGIAEDR
jgi:FkbM family methyltransferase